MNIFVGYTYRPQFRATTTIIDFRKFAKSKNFNKPFKVLFQLCTQRFILIFKIIKRAIFNKHNLVSHIIKSVSHWKTWADIYFPSLYISTADHWFVEMFSLNCTYKVWYTASYILVPLTIKYIFYFCIPTVKVYSRSHRGRL